MDPTTGHPEDDNHLDGDTTRTLVGSDRYRIAVLEDQVDGLTRALHSRDVIGQAKGILVAHYDISADEALTLLVQVSQHTNIKLADLAQLFVARVRERGPVQQCPVVTAVLEGLLARTELTAADRQDAGPNGDNHNDDNEGDM